MSKVKTIHDVETESEQIIIKKKVLDTQVENFQKKLHELNSHLIQKGGESKEDKEKFNICYEALTKMKSERDILKHQIKNLNEQLEKMKNSQKLVGKIKGLETVITNDDVEKGIDKFYNENLKKNVDSFRSEINKFFELK